METDGTAMLVLLLAGVGKQAFPPSARLTLVQTRKRHLDIFAFTTTVLGGMGIISIKTGVRLWSQADHLVAAKLPHTTRAVQTRRW